MEAFNIQEYMTRGVERVVKESIRATLSNPAESIFMAKFASSAKKAAKKRKNYEADGINIPPFLIASITSACNLHCAGCYSRHNHATTDDKPVEQLSSDEWKKIFAESADIGVSFILLAGGEPLLRRDVIEAAADYKDILFPIFTNGTVMSEAYYDVFDKNRNLIPIISLEGGKETTDERRGDGIYDKLINTMNDLNKKGIVFGASITLTHGNLRDVMTVEFMRSLIELGCRAVIFVEYVPMDDTDTSLAPDETDEALIMEKVNYLRTTIDDAIFVAFPGDEKSSRGCIAAGRGFFHINSHGAAEPCPFSPYSDINVRDTSVLDAISSKLFSSLRDGGYLLDDHIGGCVLSDKKDEVESLLKENLFQRSHHI